MHYDMAAKQTNTNVLKITLLYSVRALFNETFPDARIS